MGAYKAFYVAGNNILIGVESTLLMSKWAPLKLGNCIWQTKPESKLEMIKIDQFKNNEIIKKLMMIGLYHRKKTYVWFLLW